MNNVSHSQKMIINNVAANSITMRTPLRFIKTTDYFTFRFRDIPSFSSYLFNNNLSTHPPLGYCFSHWLCKCTPNTFPSTLSNPPPSSSPSPIVQVFLSGVNGSGKRLSNRHDRPSLKQKGRILKGGMFDATRRRQSLK